MAWKKPVRARSGVFIVTRIFRGVRGSVSPVARRGPGGRGVDRVSEPPASVCYDARHRGLWQSRTRPQMGPASLDRILLRGRSPRVRPPVTRRAPDSKGSAASQASHLVAKIGRTSVEDQRPMARSRHDGSGLRSGSGPSERSRSTWWTRREPLASTLVPPGSVGEPVSGRGERNCAVISDAGAVVRFVRESRARSETRTA